MPHVSALDHLVLTVADVAATCRFYERMLGMTAEAFHPADGTTRYALTFGLQKINLHQAGAEFQPAARVPQPGTADLCFLSETPIEDWISHLERQNQTVEGGPIRRTGATGPILSIYIRDPDGNLIEIANAADPGAG